mmetsp:Transcript_44235/g.114934  ORF Transcript_44235/g.114934 Transcript_44235/m.114934 type:complete len:250 (+) Transcript_44235:2608-3357(+)
MESLGERSLWHPLSLPLALSIQFNCKTSHILLPIFLHRTGKTILCKTWLFMTISAYIVIKGVRFRLKKRARKCEQKISIFNILKNHSKHPHTVDPVHRVAEARTHALYTTSTLQQLPSSLSLENSKNHESLKRTCTPNFNLVCFRYACSLVQRARATAFATLTFILLLNGFNCRAAAKTVFEAGILKNKFMTVGLHLFLSRLSPCSITATHAADLTLLHLDISSNSMASGFVVFRYSSDDSNNVHTNRK